MTPAEAEILADQILRAAKLEDWRVLGSELAGPLAEAGAEGVADAASALPEISEHAFSLANEDAIAYAKDRAAELVGAQHHEGQLIEALGSSSISATTRDGLRRLIVDALLQGSSAQELAAAIGESFLFSAARAEMIARTELAAAMTQGNLAAWGRSGVPMKQSLLGSEHDLDDVCDENAEAGPIPVGSAFPSGDLGPPYHPNCVCAVIPVQG